MNDLKLSWKNADFGSAKENQFEKLGGLTHFESIGVLAQIKTKVKKKFYSAIILGLCFAGAIPFSFPLASQILMTILIVAYLVAAILLYQELQLLNPQPDFSKSLRDGLIAYRNRVFQILKLEETIGLPLYPVSIVAGYLFGIQLYSRNADFMSNSVHWLILLLLIICLTIAGHFVTKWLNMKSFGKYLDQLDTNIKELSEPD